MKISFLNPASTYWAWLQRVAVAVLFSLFLFGYYLFQGVRYWQVSGDVSETRREIASLERKINSLPQVDEIKTGISTELQQQLSDLEGLQRLFNFPGTDELLAIVSSTAADAGLELLSVRADTPREETLELLAHSVQVGTISSEGASGAPTKALAGAPAEDPAGASTKDEKTEIPEVLAYQVQPVTISMEGSPDNVTRFLDSLQRRVPVVSAPSIRIAGLDGVTTSKIQLLFYLSPHDVPEEENASAGADNGGAG